jgi:hypothetical protein
VGIDWGCIVLTYHSPLCTSGQPGDGTNWVTSRINHYPSGMVEPTGDQICELRYLRTMVVKGGGRAEQRMGRQPILAGAINLVGASLDVTLWCHEDLHISGEGTHLWGGWIWYLPYCICTWHKGQIERRRRGPVRNHPPARGRGEDRYRNDHGCVCRTRERQRILPHAPLRQAPMVGCNIRKLVLTNWLWRQCLPGIHTMDEL